MINYALEKNSGLTETKVIALHSLTTDISIFYFNKKDVIPEDYIPVGSIDFIHNILGYVPKPNYYPDFMSNFLFRDVWETDVFPLEKDVFIKPSDKSKRFTGKLTTGTYKGKKKPPFWCSSKINFINEWRIYVSDGKPLAVYWYDGIDEEAVMPVFDENVIPNDWCGTIDMGTTSNGEFALVECHMPFSIGWYGGFSNSVIFEEFSRKGWEYMRRSSWKDFSKPTRL